MCKAGGPLDSLWTENSYNCSDVHSYIAEYFIMKMKNNNMRKIYFRVPKNWKRYFSD